MRHPIAVFLFCLALVPANLTNAQTGSTASHSISLQPVLWLDNLIPTELTAISIQYEALVGTSDALCPRVVWFRNPLVGPATSGTNGYGVSLEYRHYFSDDALGWHIGPFVEWGSFRYLGDLRAVYGTSSKNLFDVGVSAGHKWQTSRMVFDISARTSYYSPSSYPKEGYFPRLPGSNLNSMMILTLGYLLP
jgi:hypothetical protein